MLLSEVKTRKCNSKPIITQKVKVRCDKCGKNYTIIYSNFLKGKIKCGNDMCSGCKTGIRNKTMMTPEIKAKISKSLMGKKSGAEGLKWTQEQKDNLKKVRPNTGTWDDTYGVDKASQMKQNLSNRFSGSGNNMYGKPSPIGSGNGWSGWYKEWYFRSLIELSYMINVIEKNNFTWESAESKKYKMPYKKDGADRNYYCDFVLEDKELIEIKPKNLRNSIDVLLKEEAAIKWCKEHNLKYRIVCDNEFDKLSKEEIKLLHDEGSIKFIDRYEEKYKNI